MKILFACSELYPLIKTGGLADVAFNLPLAIKQTGQDIRIVLPAYRQVKQANIDSCVLTEMFLNGHRLVIRQAQVPNTEIPLYLVDCPELFDCTNGGPYSSMGSDSGERFGLFCQVIAAIALNRAGLDWQPDILHGNDWQTGLSIALVSLNSHKPGTLFTIHNLAYQGIFPADLMQRLHLPEVLWDFRGLEYHGNLAFIKGGIAFADCVNTVSPGYAAEITHAEFGCGLDGLLRYRGKRFCGILNGINTESWNPFTDTAINTRYSKDSLDEKRKNKRWLLQQFGLADSTESDLLLAMVGRLAEQKGIDLVLEAIPELMKLPVNLVFLGTGEVAYEQSLQAAADRYPGRIGLDIGYDEAQAHRVIAGADAIMIPSRYEPCGLTQMYGQCYGSVPIARSVGGLANTVVDAEPAINKDSRATGILFQEYSSQALVDAVLRALQIYQQPNQWKILQNNGMQQDLSWHASAQKYLQLYTQCAPVSALPFQSMVASI